MAHANLIRRLAAALVVLSLLALHAPVSFAAPPHIRRLQLGCSIPGTVVGWGWNGSGQITPPPGLSGVTAIAAGYAHSLALKADGTVVGWGYNSYDQATPPSGLSSVTAIAAGHWHSLALKSDGTVVGWGDNYSGKATPPAGLGGVTAIAAGGDHSLALQCSPILLTLKGSSSVYPIVQGSQAQFESDSAHPIGPGNRVALQLEPAPGSGTTAGLATLCSGTADVALVSRKANSGDCTTTPWGRGDLQETILGREAVAVVVPATRTVTCTTRSQLYPLYTSTAATLTWAMLGDTSPRAADRVVPRALSVGSTTRDAFNTLNGVGDLYEQAVITATGLARLASGTDMVSALATMPNRDGLGYVTLSYMETHPDVKAVAYDAGDGRGCVAPDMATVAAATYGLARDLSLYTLKRDATPPPLYLEVKWDALRAYLDWMQGPFGQRWVVNADFVMVQRPAMDLNDSGEVDGGDYVVVGKYFGRRWVWWPY